LQKDDLIQLINSVGAFRVSQGEPFLLSSGATSPFYFDLRRLCGSARGISKVAEAVYDTLQDMGNIKSIGGLESGSIPIATAVSQYSHDKDPKNAIDSFYVRKNPKEHGTRNFIEGILRQPAAVVDDVITSGGSALRAVQAVRTAGHTCNALLSIIFRGTQEQEAALRRSCKFRYLLTESDFTTSTAKYNSYTNQDDVAGIP